MARHLERLHRVLSRSLLLALGVLILQALAYGLAFAVDPAAGVGEFGYGRPVRVDALTMGLVAEVGAGMVAAAALLALSAVWIWRENPAGTSVALVIGATYVLAGGCAFRAGWVWDGYFYSLTGVGILLLSGAVRWLRPRLQAAESAWERS